MYEELTRIKARIIDAKRALRHIPINNEEVERNSDLRWELFCAEKALADWDAMTYVDTRIEVIAQDIPEGSTITSRDCRNDYRKWVDIAIAAKPNTLAADDPYFWLVVKDGKRIPLPVFLREGRMDELTGNAAYRIQELAALPCMTYGAPDAEGEENR